MCSAIYVLCICSSASITNVSSVKLSHKTALSLLSLFTSSALQERHFNIFTSLGKKHLKVGCYVRKKHNRDVVEVMRLHWLSFQQNVFSHVKPNFGEQMRLHAVYKYKGILLVEKAMHTNAQERGILSQN